MIALSVMAQTDGSGQIAAIASTFGVTWSLLAAQIISFTIVCALLYRFAYAPILRMLDERRRQIAQGLANASEINARLAGIEEQRQGVLAAARVEAAGIVSLARTTARRVEQEGRQQAGAEADRIVLKARETAALEHAQMLASLKREVGRLVVQTSEAVIGSVMTPADHRRLAEDAARHLKAADRPGQAAP